MMRPMPTHHYQRHIANSVIAERTISYRIASPGAVAALAAIANLRDAQRP